MTYRECIRVAFRGLLTNTLRSLLTMLGIVIGVAAVITMLAVGQGAHTQISEQIRSLGANVLMVIPGVAKDAAARLATGTSPTLTEEDAAAISREISLVEVAAPSVRGKSQVVNGNRNWRTRINGTEPDYFIVRDWPISLGRTITKEDVRTAAKIALLGTTVVESLFEGADPIGRSIRIGNVPFIVIGVLGEKGPSGTGRDQDDVVFVPIMTAKLRLFGSLLGVNRQAVAYILTKVVNSDAMENAERQIKRLLRQRHRLLPDEEDDFLVINPAAAMAAQQSAKRTFTVLLAAVASVSLIVGGISIMNIMLVSVTERTREIGLRLTVGARRRDIRRQFLVEAVTLCLLGGIIGFMLGVGAAIVIARLSGWPVFIGPGAVGLAVGFAGLVGIFFGYYPATKASRLNPIEALRIE